MNMPNAKQPVRGADAHVDVDGAYSLVEVLRARAAQQSHRRAYTFLPDGEKQALHLSYGELDQQARVIAANLQDLGLQGGRAVLLYPQGLDYIAAFFGCLYAGVVAVPAYPPRNNRHLPRLQTILADCQAAAILTNQSTSQTLEALFGAVPTVPILATDVLDNADGGWQLPGSKPQDVAFLQYTSGSTGDAKGVMVTHANLMANQRLIKQGFGHDPQSTVVGWLPLYHDMGLIGNVMQPLYIGAPVVLMPPLAFLEKPLRWLQAVSDYRAHTSGGPNFAFDFCVQKISAEEKSRLDLSAWQVAFNGAEPVHAATLERFAEAFAGCGFQRRAFYPCYGLAEATLLVTGGDKAAPPTVKAFHKEQLEGHIASTGFVGDASRFLVGCGFVGENHRLRITDTQTQALCGPGCVGEIQVSGAGVAQGYWQNTVATSESFVEDGNHQIWLRTGDLGFIDEGELFVVGRSKDLIIIRGRNYYPHDLEMAAAASVACLNPNGLAAFSVADGNEEKLVLLAELKRGHLRQTDFRVEFAAIRGRLVEECGIQAAAIVFVRPGAILKTTSGKIRRSDCKKAFLDQQMEVVAKDGCEPAPPAATHPSGPEGALLRHTLLAASLESGKELLANFLSGKIRALSGLSVEPVDWSVPVLALGIDSLKAMELKYAIDDLLAIDVPVTLILADTSIMELAACALDLGHQKHLALVATAEPDTAANLALSLGQRAVWTVCQFEANTPVYNLPVALQISGKIEVDSFRHALRVLVSRHTQLRTGYRLENGLPMPVLLPEANPVFVQHTCKDARARDRLLIAEIRRPFDLEHDLKLRAALFSTADDDPILLFCAHHIAVDFRSLVILLGELQAVYGACSIGQAFSLPTLAATYDDFIAWQQNYLSSALAGQALGYWQGQLAGDLPKLSLPAGKVRPNTATYHGGIEILAIGFATLRQLQDMAAQQGVTLYMLLLAVFKVLLYRYSGQEDIIVGSPMFGRPKQDFSQVVGYFVNPVALRSYPEGGKPFIGFLHETKQTVLAALRHQDYPHGLLVEKLQPAREPGLSAFYRASFVLQSDVHGDAGAAALALGLPDCQLAWVGITARTVCLPETVAQFDLNLMMAVTGDGLAASFQYNHSVLEQETVMRMAGHFQRLLQGVLENPYQPLSALPLLAVSELRQLMAWSGAIVDCPTDDCIHHRFEKQAMATPDAIAVVFEGQVLSYAELNAKANQLAHFLRSQGVVADTLVGICVPRSLTMIVGLLGILKAGGAYLPLDPDYPQDRLAYLVADAKPLLVLTEQPLAGSLPANLRLLCLDAVPVLLETYGIANPVNVGGSENLAYVIYTSGSSGNPKGVAITHQNVRRLFAAAGRLFDFSSADVWSLFHSFAFDFSVWEIWGALLYGGKLVVVPYWACRSPEAFHRLLSVEGVTVLSQTPSSFYQLDAFDGEPGKGQALSLRWVIFGGEALEPWRLRGWFARHAGTGPRLVNMYGITETTVHVTHHGLPASPNTDAASIIGRPLGDLQTFIFDPRLAPVPIGVAGELYVGGAGLARGYLNRPGLTAERFIPHPYPVKPGQRLYRTGDVARYRPDGQIEYLGRIDTQVKIRGFRIELGEIEARLLQHEAIKKTVVLLKQEPGNKYLIAYLVARIESPPDVHALKAFLKQTLPDYMVPAAFVFLDDLPLTANGKLDRKALLAMASQGWQRREYTPPRDEAEQAVAEIWQQILGVERLGIHDDFFELGGHSLSAVQVVSKIRETFAVDVPVKTLFEAPTIAEFVDKVGEHQTD